MSIEKLRVFQPMTNYHQSTADKGKQIEMFSHLLWINGTIMRWDERRQRVAPQARMKKSCWQLSHQLFTSCDVFIRVDFRLQLEAFWRVLMFGFWGGENKARVTYGNFGANVDKIRGVKWGEVWGMSIDIRELSGVQKVKSWKILVDLIKFHIEQPKVIC